MQAAVKGARTILTVLAKALVPLPRANVFATKIAPGAHAILVLDQAGWACCQATQDSEQDLASAVAAALTRTQQPREYLAVHAPQLALKPELQIFR
jgi:hypothetical protein